MTAANLTSLTEQDSDDPFFASRFDGARSQGLAGENVERNS